MDKMAQHRPLALVSGAGRGIGRATALRLARQGMDLVLMGRDAERLQAVGAQAEALGARVTLAPGDLLAEAFWQSLPEALCQADVLVHNASQPAAYGLLEAVELDALRGVLDSVLLAGLRLTRMVLPHMKAREHGRIVFVGSLAWQLGAHGQVGYAAAKAGLLGLVRSVALEAGRHGVTCNLVEPGFIDTERTREAVGQAMRQALSSRAALGRSGTPDEVAALIAFLASADASYITGACIPVSGGIELGLPASSRSTP